MSHTHTDWIQYWYKQGDQKTGIFTVVVRPTSLCQPNRQRPGILVLTSYQNLDVFIMWFNSMIEIILSLRIKYNNSTNWKKKVMRKIHHVKTIKFRPRFLSPLLHSVFLCNPQFKNHKKNNNTLLSWGKAPIRVHYWKIQSPAVRSKAWTLWMPRFQPCCMIGLTGYSLSTNKVIRKTGQFTVMDFTMATKLTNSWYSGAHLLPKSWYIYNVIQFYVWNYFEYENKIWRQ